MRIGFRFIDYRKAIPLAAKLGFVDLEPEWSLAYSADYSAMAAAGKEYGVRTSAVLTGMDPMSVADFRHAFEDCNRIGALSFTAHPHPLGLEDMEAQRRFQAIYGEAAELGKKMGVKLAVHSCGLGPEQWDLMFRLVPGLWLKYDPSFSQEAGRNLPSEIFKYGKRIAHVHAKDELSFARTTDYQQGMIPMTYAPPGMGDIHWGTVIAALYEVGYDEQIAIEPHSHYWANQALERGLILAKRHLEQWLA
jgi:sugar phosphate isomerase/epimerase